MKQNQSGKKLERGKDYINVHDNTVIVIDRVEGLTNRGFDGEEYKNYLSCKNHSNWREATKEEVIEAFEKHLINRYGEDWQTMKIKERHPNSTMPINDGSWTVGIYTKTYDGWVVWNVNGILYGNGIWVERLEDIEEMNKKEKATRHNEGKKRWSLVHYKSLEPLVEVLEFGAERYGEFNWQKGFDKKEILESMMRHLTSLMDGEQNDKESGLHHIGHIMCNAMFYEYFNNKAKTNRL